MLMQSDESLLQPTFKSAGLTRWSEIRVDLIEHHHRSPIRKKNGFYYRAYNLSFIF